MRPSDDARRAVPWLEVPLLIVTAISSVSFGQLFVALPFFTGAMGGGPDDVGLVGALYTGGYVAAMLAGRRLLDRLHPRTIAVIGSAVLCAATLILSTCDTLAGLWITVTAYGLATSWHWPPVMGMLSTGAEGPALNRRLGRFNAAWSGGLIAGPMLGGWLFDRGAAIPFLVAAVIHALCAVLVVTVRFAQGSASPAPNPAFSDPSPSAISDPPLLPADPRTPVYRRMARVALVCSYLVVGLLRYQLPGLAESELKITATGFGPIGTLFSAAQSAGFILLGLTHGWHFRRRWMWGAQLGLGLSLLPIFVVQSAAGLMACSVLAGLGVSFLYASHLYYGVSGGARRTRLMAVHETLLSVGFLIGSYAGGFVADAMGRRWPYVFCGAVVILGAGVELVIYRRAALTLNTDPLSRG